MKYENLNSNVFLSDRKFYDDNHFPYGFHRSGDFTITEADILVRYGYTMNQLMKGEIEPSEPEHKRLLQVIKGQEQVKYIEEAVFLKYIHLIDEKEKTFPPVKKVKIAELAIGDESDDSDEFLE